MDVAIGAVAQALAQAARLATAAPSIFNMQPWRLTVEPPVLTLAADVERRLRVDPLGRLLTVSCGAALHHARVALAASGFAAVVERLPDPRRPELLARLHATLPHRPTPDEIMIAAAATIRRTDRRAYGDEPVPPDVLHRLGMAARAQGAELHIVRADQMPLFSVIALRAADVENADVGYRAELTRWVNRPPWSGDGVPRETAVRPGPRRVPVRDFTLDPGGGMPIGPGTDRGAAYAVLFGRDDEPAAWLRAGEALSAVLLTATVEGLSSAPISDVVEVGTTRALVRGLLPVDAHPYIALRVGLEVGGDTVPRSPRRAASEAIDIRQ
ncbi:MAG TPA: nitroreductase [Micromonosporaceae bacterium]|jgi:hypothetical protein|nr:nitroreductase [Micromonosporaceae bacterium]